MPNGNTTNTTSRTPVGMAAEGAASDIDARISAIDAQDRRDEALALLRFAQSLTLGSDEGDQLSVDADGFYYYIEAVKARLHDK